MFDLFPTGSPAVSVLGTTPLAAFFRSARRKGSPVLTVTVSTTMVRRKASRIPTCITCRCRRTAGAEGSARLGQFSPDFYCGRPKEPYRTYLVSDHEFAEHIRSNTS